LISEETLDIIYEASGVSNDRESQGWLLSDQELCYTYGDFMKIEVKLFANFRDYLPEGSDRFSCMVKVNPSGCVSDVLGKLGLPADHPKIILINGVHGKEDDLLKDGDVLSVFPPVAGG
jgi:molybdopterin converting factor small subunit